LDGNQLYFVFIGGGLILGFFSGAVLLARPGSKPYLDPDLTLPIPAEKLGAARNHLSYVINHKLQKNFFEYVNEYRVGDVQRLMADPGRRGSRQ